MTMEQIDFFLMTVRCDTFLEAAENLHIAQSTLSKQIQKLESELNLTLFDRTRRQAVLTPAGELFCQEASELSRQYHQMLQKMRHFKESERQPLRVGSLPFLTQYHLTSRIRAFAHTHPEVELMLEECEENELMDGLQSGRFDLVIARDSMISPQKYHFVPLAKDRLCVLLPNDHPLAEKSSLTIADIAREPLILMHPYTSIYQLCMQLFEKADQKPHILRTARLESIISSVEVGEALSLFAGSNFALFHHPNVTAVPLRDAPPLVIGAAYPLKMKASKKPGNISAQTLKSFVFFIQNPV